MDIKEVAEKLNGQNIDKGFSPGNIDLKELGFVIAYGQSDDLLELEGSIRDEYGAYNGTTIKLNSNGVLENQCEDEDCPYFLKEERDAKLFIKAEWDSKEEDAIWLITTNIPHETFNIINDDNELWCKGIVFDIKSLKVQLTTVY